MKSAAPTPSPDNLITPEVGAWAETKYKLVGLYSSLFSTGMKDKWDCRVYLDLYAGAGQNRIRDTQRLVYGSPLIALQVDHPFDKYIFCEEDDEKLSALRVRSKRVAPGIDPVFIHGDSNKKVDQIVSAIPPGSSSYHVLSLCFVDPYGIGIHFSTIRKLATRYVDFLVLLAVYMDANRNYARYVKEDSRKVDEFLGNKDWRERWKTRQMEGEIFPRFLAQEYASSMRDLGYAPTPLYLMKEVRSDEKNLRLYHLALFSRSEKAHDFWKQVLKYSTDQRSMFED